MEQWTKGTVISNRHWTENLFSLRVDADVQTFEAGQYTSLALDLDGRRIADPYSLLSPPSERPLEFFLYTRPEGELSTALANLRSGDSVWVQQNPEGDFRLSNVPDGEILWLLATGTGVAPFLSMLRMDAPWQRFRHIVLVYAVRYADDLCYMELVNELRAKFPDCFTFVPFISRQATHGAVHGHIPDCISRGILERESGHTLDPASSQVMLCGNPGMVRDAVSALHKRGFRDNVPGQQPGQLSYESYW